MPLDNSTEADRRLVAMMDEAMEDALSVTKSWLDIWTDGYNYIFNNQLAGKQRKDGWEKISANYIWPAIRQRLSSLALRTPQVYAKAWNPDQQSKADLWNGVLQWQYEKELKMQALNLAAMLDGEVYGYYVGKVTWNARKEWNEERQEWVGGPEITMLAPERFGCDPEAECLDDAAYAFSQRRMLVSEAIRAASMGVPESRW